LNDPKTLQQQKWWLEAQIERKVINPTKKITEMEGEAGKMERSNQMYNFYLE